jgi:O-antigen/teichoic acid export membrane protein
METNEQIKRHSLKSVKWVALGFMLPKLVTPIVTILLAKLLSPAVFGIIAICSVFIGVINLIQGLGFSDFIIKEFEINDIFLSTAFWSNFALSIIVFGLMWIAAPIVANIYNEPLIKKVLPVLGFAVVFNGVGTIQWALLQKEMKFKRLFNIQVLPLIVSICITLPLAYYGYGVWALVAGEVSKSFFVNVGYWLVGKWMPHFVYSVDAAKQMIKFGRWIMVEKLQEYLYSNLDRIILSYFGGLTTLGIYTIARQIVFVLFNAINGPIGGIIYPMLSKIRAEIDELRYSFFEVTKRVMLLNIPVTVAVAVLSFDLIPFLFSKNKWHGLPLVLCIGVMGEGAVRNIWAQREMFKILNRPDLYPKSIMINLLFAVVCYPFGAMNGLIVFSIVRTLNDWVYVVVQTLLTSMIFKFKVIEFVRLSFSSIFSSLLMAGGIVLSLAILQLFGISTSVIPILLIILLAVFLYVLSFRLFWRKDYNKFWDEMKIVVGISDCGFRSANQLK